MDPDNIGVVIAGFEDITDWDCPSDTDMVLHFKKVFEGYLTMVRRAPAAPLPVKDIPVADQVKGAGFRPDEIAKMPVSRRVQVRVGDPGRRAPARQERVLPEPATGKPAHLDELVFKWYGDPDAKIAGYRNGEVDIATDLQDSDLPKVQDLGDQVSGDPGRSRTSTCGRTGRRTGSTRTNQVGGCSKEPGGRGPRHGLPDGRPRDARGGRLRGRQGRDQHAAARRQRPGREHERLSPAAWFYEDQSPDDLRPGQGQADPRGWRLDRPRRGRHPREERPQGQDRAVHDDPPGPPGHAGPRRGMAQGRRHRQRSSTRCRRRTSSPTTTSRRTTPRAAVARSNFDLAEHAFARRSTRSATTSATTAASSTRRARTTRRSTIRTSTRRSMTSRTASTSRSIKDAMADVPAGLRREDDRDPAVLPQEGRPARPAARQLPREPAPGGLRLERRGLVRHPIVRASLLDVAPTGCPEIRAPRRSGPAGSGAPWVYCPRKPFDRGRPGGRPVHRTASGLRPNADDQVRDPSRAPGDPCPVRDHHRRLRDPARRARVGRRPSSPRTRG